MKESPPCLSFRSLRKLTSKTKVSHLSEHKERLLFIIYRSLSLIVQSYCYHFSLTSERFLAVLRLTRSRVMLITLQDGTDVWPQMRGEKTFMTRI